MKKGNFVSMPLVLFYAVCFMFLFSQTACAYIDPSTTTFIIQAVAGLAIAIGTVVVVYYRKAKKKVMEKLHIDENAKKEMEDELQVKNGVLNEDATSEK